MTKPGEAAPAQYFPGDDIRLRVSWTSGATITAVEVVYAHLDHPWITLTLEGNAESEEDSPAYGPNKRGTAIVSGVAEFHHAVGVYVVSRVVFYTFTGFPMVYDRKDERPEGDGDPGPAALPGIQPVPGRWPMLAINRGPHTIGDVVAEIAEDD
jgi:hypothetical protein